MIETVSWQWGSNVDVWSRINMLDLLAILFSSWVFHSHGHPTVRKGARAPKALGAKPMRMVKFTRMYTGQVVRWRVGRRRWVRKVGLSAHERGTVGRVEMIVIVIAWCCRVRC